jgi:hypothetical protein
MSEATRDDDVDPSGITTDSTEASSSAVQNDSVFHEQETAEAEGVASKPKRKRAPRKPKQPVSMTVLDADSRVEDAQEPVPETALVTSTADRVATLFSGIEEIEVEPDEPTDRRPMRAAGFALALLAAVYAFISLSVSYSYSAVSGQAGFANGGAMERFVRVIEETTGSFSDLSTQSMTASVNAADLARQRREAAPLERIAVETARDFIKDTLVPGVMLPEAFNALGRNPADLEAVFVQYCRSSGAASSLAPPQAPVTPVVPGQAPAVAQPSSMQVLQGNAMLLERFQSQCGLDVGCERYAASRKDYLAGKSLGEQPTAEGSAAAGSYWIPIRGRLSCARQDMERIAMVAATVDGGDLNLNERIGSSLAARFPGFNPQRADDARRFALEYRVLQPNLRNVGWTEQPFAKLWEAIMKPGVLLPSFLMAVLLSVMSGGIASVLRHWVTLGRAGQASGSSFLAFGLGAGAGTLVMTVTVVVTVLSSALLSSGMTGQINPVAITIIGALAGINAALVLEWFGNRFAPLKNAVRSRRGRSSG